MFRHLCSLLLGISVPCASFLCAQSGNSDGPAPAKIAEALADGFRSNLVIAKPRAGATAAELLAYEGREGVKLRTEPTKAGRLRLLELAPSDSPLEAVQRLQASGLYEYVEPDYRRARLATPNDPRFGEQWWLRNTGQSGGRAGADISAVAAWDVRSSAESVVVAVLDTGIRLTHEDLAANLWVNSAEIPGNGIDDDGNGYIDDVHGINSLLPLGTPGTGDPSDDDGHGTAVAGVIGAVGDNGRGIAGVAWRTKIMALKFDERERKPDIGGGTFVSNIVECVDYAVAKGAKVINISYGGFAYSQAEYDALQRARAHGVIVVAAAGNEGTSTELAASYPASYLIDNVLSVANTDRNDALSFASTYGGLVELAAPGTDILTCGHESDSEYIVTSGTSLSSPVVAGSLALMRAQFPDDTPRALINRLLRSVDAVPELAGRVTSGGRLNLARALNANLSRPFNDDFGDRVRLAGESTVTRGASAGGTLEAGEPTHGAAGGASLWWTWTAPRSGMAIVDTMGSSFDTTVAVYSGSALAQLTQIAVNDDAEGRTTSRVSFPATQGAIYQIAVDGKGGAIGVVSLAVAMQPPNDNFSSAQVLSGLSGETFGTNVNATREAGEPDAPMGSGSTVWYKWVAPRTATFSAVVQTYRFSPVVSVYRGTALGDLTLESTNFYGTAFAAEAGATYYFAVDSFSADTGAFTLTYLEAYVIPYSWSVSSSPAIGRDGSIAVIDDEALLFLFKSEFEWWSRELPGSVDVNTPAIAPDGTIYLTTSSGLFALSSSNTIKWEKRNDGGASASPAIAADGTVYVHSDSGWLHAYTPKGSEKWRARVPGVSYASPSIGADGTIYLGSDDGWIYAVAPTDGTVKWRFDTGGEVYASIAIGLEDSLCVGNLEGKFYSLTSAGTQRWVFTAGGAISSSAAFGADGTVYFGAYDGKLYALNPSGSLKWAYTTGGEILGSSPLVVSDGTIYIGSYDGKLHAVTTGGTMKQVYPTGGVIRSSPLSYDGDVVFGSGDGNIYFVTDGMTPANSPWPMHRQNAARTGRRNLTTAPAIHTQPASRTIGIGTSTTLAVNANGADPIAFQWYVDGAPIAGATESSYTISNATAGQSGQYTVVVTNSHGSVTSAAAQVNVVAASNLGRIVNLSARAIAGSGDKTMIVGFVVGGGQGNKQLLIRGAGASLAAPPFNVQGTLSDPKITVFDGQTPILSNDDWENDEQLISVGNQVGAFQFSSAKDAALVASVSPRGYSAHITASTGNGSGVALAEFYDTTQVFTAGSARLINISTRAEVGRGDDILIVGFYIAGDTPCKVVIRASGPALTQHNVQGVLANPKVEVRNQAREVIGENDDWTLSGYENEPQSIRDQLSSGFAAGSKDAALVMTLKPGLYSVLVSGVGNTTGVALAEVYQAD